jgi:excisionase family DNA binding protein
MRKRKEVTSHDCEKLLYTIDEAAQALSLGRSLLYQLVLTGQIASIKVGRYRRIPVVSLKSYVEQLLLHY